jgi:ADP-ribose pyrophosphatase YjhB (NUDIX family)
VSATVPVCPHCLDDVGPIVCDRCGWRWYRNPKPAAAVLLERTDPGADEPSILLLRRAVNPGLGDWDLPAGYLDPGESFEDGARREAREESGIEVRLIALAGVYHSPDANAVTTVYRAAALDPSAQVATDHESSEHAWVPRSEVDAWIGRMAFAPMARAVADWAAGRIGGPSGDGR